jgi:Tfp pilus assembly protein PilX
MYLWTAPGRDAAALRRTTGVSDDQSRARQAAELLLRTGEATTAYIECAYTAATAATLNPCYVRTGTGWWAQLSQADHVVWTPFTASGG